MRYRLRDVLALVAVRIYALVVYVALWLWLRRVTVLAILLILAIMLLTMTAPTWMRQDGWTPYPAPKSLPPVPRIHTLYLPLIFTAPADVRFSIQQGWGSDCCAATLTSLGFDPALGANTHRQLAANEMSGIIPHEFYDACGSGLMRGLEWCPPLAMTYPPCTWDMSDRRWIDTADCATWLLANPGKSYYVGNEPDCGERCGGVGQSNSDFADMFHNIYTALKQLDPTCKVYVGAWARNIWHETAGEFIAAYNSKYGTVQSDGWTIHYYQAITPTIPDSRTVIQDFIDHLALSDVSSRQIRITELGWYMPYPPKQSADVVEFLDYIVPYLLTQPTVERWFWWTWTQGDASTLVNSDGTLTLLGQCYSSLARGGRCD